MSVGLFVDPIYYSIGTASFLNSFFSTIYLSVEKSDWGSRYPIIMNDLYGGCVKKDRLDKLEDEIVKLRNDFKKLKPEKVVWDFENLKASPSWGTNISKEITNLSDYFVTSDGKNLFDTIEKAIETSKEIDEDLRIKNI